VRDDLEGSGAGFIYAFWHGRQVFLAYLHMGDNLHPLISLSRDGELIARVCRSFGLEPVRGSSSRGGMEALMELKDVIDSGDRVAITPDGPRGPRCTVQPGVLFLAQKTGCPIVPVAFGARKAWVFKGWDEFIVPRPFNRIAMVYGQPVRIGIDDSLEIKGRELKAALDSVVVKADEMAV